ncbi:BON domain-containing protein [Winogradskyella helgolandensis]|uniref:BON domain-containing protein n=1 Tax=Winogradskyella helgolandensis TaxID=2697010 RepID=UPI0015B9BB59|nr:BON domain-containing protein [Winogradskyella helgolandensis]
MRTDESIKEDILEELSWQPNIDETEIGVIVKNGVVTLSGIVDNYTKKRNAEKAVRHVSGVKAVAEGIVVKYGVDNKTTDTEIAKAVVDALKRNSSVPEEKIEAKVENGWVYLTGNVEWEYQRIAAKTAVEDLLGVHGVTNEITLKPIAKPVDIKNKIKQAFERMADIDAKNIYVDVEGHTVKLHGRVNSILEKDEARKTAYSAPGVYDVKNELEII